MKEETQEDFEKSQADFYKEQQDFLREIRAFEIYGDVVLDKENGAIEFSDSYYPFSSCEIQIIDFEYEIIKGGNNFMVKVLYDLDVENEQRIIKVNVWDMRENRNLSRRFEELNRALLWILNIEKKWA